MNEWLKRGADDIHRAHLAVTGGASRYRSIRIDPDLDDKHVAEATFGGRVSVNAEVAARIMRLYGADGQLCADTVGSTAAVRAATGDPTEPAELIEEPDEQAGITAAGAVHVLVHEGEHVRSDDPLEIDAAESDIATYRTARLAEEAFAELASREITPLVIAHLDLPEATRHNLLRSGTGLNAYPLITAMAESLVSDAGFSRDERRDAVIEIGRHSGNARLDAFARAYVWAHDDSAELSPPQRRWLSGMVSRSTGLALGAVQDLRYDAEGMPRDPSADELAGCVEEHRLAIRALVTAAAVTARAGEPLSAVRDANSRRDLLLVTSQLEATNRRQGALARNEALASIPDHVEARHNATGYRIMQSSYGPAVLTGLATPKVSSSTPAPLRQPSAVPVGSARSDRVRPSHGLGT